MHSGVEGGREVPRCQLIRLVNKEKRLQWTREYRCDSFEDVVWSDEPSVRFLCHKLQQKPRYKPRPKHPVKVHV